MPLSPLEYLRHVLDKSGSFLLTKESYLIINRASVGTLVLRVLVILYKSLENKEKVYEAQTFARQNPCEEGRS